MSSHSPLTFCYPRPFARTTAGESGPYDDLNGFLHRAGELATELLSEGITAMKDMAV